MAAINRAQARMRELMERMASMAREVPQDFINTDAIPQREASESELDLDQLGVARACCRDLVGASGVVVLAECGLDVARVDVDRWVIGSESACGAEVPERDLGRVVSASGLGGAEMSGDCLVGQSGPSEVISGFWVRECVAGAVVFYPVVDHYQEGRPQALSE